MNWGRSEIPPLKFAGLRQMAMASRTETERTPCNAGKRALRSCVRRCGPNAWGSIEARCSAQRSFGSGPDGECFLGLKSHQPKEQTTFGARAKKSYSKDRNHLRAEISTIGAICLKTFKDKLGSETAYSSEDWCMREVKSTVAITFETNRLHFAMKWRLIASPFPGKSNGEAHRRGKRAGFFLNGQDDRAGRPK